MPNIAERVKEEGYRRKPYPSKQDGNILSIYLKEINKIPLLTRSEEEVYARKAAQGDKEAKDMLVKANLRFVVNVAKRYSNLGLPLEDLINEGNLGLMRAAEKFDVNKGYHFLTYAVWWIRQAILRAIDQKSRTIRLPIKKVADLDRINKVAKYNLLEKGSYQDLEELADELGMEKEYVTELLQIAQEPVSLERPVVSYNEEFGALENLIVDPKSEDPHSLAETSTLKEDINRVLGLLSSRESKVIQMRFGLNGYTPMTLDTIGNILGLTKERIRQIEKGAIMRVRHPTRSVYLRDYVE